MYRWWERQEVKRQVLGFDAAEAVILLSCLYHPVGFFIVLVTLIAMGWHLYASRREFRSQLRLVYEELPEPAVQALSLLK